MSDEIPDDPASDAAGAQPPLAQSPGGLEANAQTLEDLAVAAWFGLLSGSRVDPKIRKEAADSVMRALGKDAPPKASGPVIQFNFGTGLKTAIGGIGQLQSLMSRAPDQHTEVLDADEAD